MVFLGGWANKCIISINNSHYSSKWIASTLPSKNNESTVTGRLEKYLQGLSIVCFTQTTWITGSIMSPTTQQRVHLRKHNTTCSSFTDSKHCSWFHYNNQTSSLKQFGNHSNINGHDRGDTCDMVAYLLWREANSSLKSGDIPKLTPAAFTFPYFVFKCPQKSTVSRRVRAATTETWLVSYTCVSRVLPLKPVNAELMFRPLFFWVISTWFGRCVPRRLAAISSSKNIQGNRREGK